MYENLVILAMLVAGAATFKTFSTKNTDTTVKSAHFVAFQRLYLAVYIFAFFGDWLQGPYVYALYSSYGFSQYDIAVLFVAGFGSSMVFGTFIGSLADKMGRKKFALLYCVAYIGSCCTKHFNDYWMLMVGRVLGGVATSLLFSVFEAWMVAEHNSRGFHSDLLSDTFSKAMFANSLVAIVSGFLANAAADIVPLTESASGAWYGGVSAPFDLAIGCLSLCMGIVFMYWNENFGTVSGDVAASSGLSLDALSGAVTIIRNDSKVFIIGTVAALFEGSMYTFVFLWTPLLQAADSKDLPFGVIFAILMLSCMTGSQVFSMLVSKYAVGTILQWLMLVAGASLFAPVFVSSPLMLMLCFMVFEVCVGIYWPCIGTLKGIYVPEGQRSAIYNVFRVPLNAIVLFVLLAKIESQTSFMCCAVLLCMGSFFVKQLNDLIAVSSLKAAPVEEMPLVSTEDAETV